MPMVTISPMVLMKSCSMVGVFRTDMKPLTVLSGVRMAGYMDVMVCSLSRGSVRPGTKDENRQFIDGGIWRFHPHTREFEVFAEGLSNPWGFDFNDMGQGFATCCVIPHLFHIVQGGVYHKQSKQNVNPYVYDNIKTIRDHTHKSAHGGARFYLADVFPEKYRDQLFMCNIHEHAVLIDYMVPKGSSFIGKHGDDFLMANDLAWVGFSVETGPDGGVYILDWHDQNICGNEIKFANSARVYRIMPKGVKGPKLLTSKSYRILNWWNYRIIPMTGMFDNPVPFFNIGHSLANWIAKKSTKSS